MDLLMMNFKENLFPLMFLVVVLLVAGIAAVVLIRKIRGKRSRKDGQKSQPAAEKSSGGKS